MPILTVFAADHPTSPLRTVRNPADVATELAAVGIRAATWPVHPGIVPGTDGAVVLAAYRDQVAAVQADGGYAAVDVVSIAPDDPDRAAKRRKFLAEHTHREDEVRFFAAGRGLFCLHLGDEVMQVLCTAGDLLVVPDGTRHWFDMGPSPAFVAIRWFTDPAGWVAQPTGCLAAGRFPLLED